jgi:hypothetical protein
VYGPLLDWVEKGHQLTFTYKGTDGKEHIVVLDTAMPTEAGALLTLISPMGLSIDAANAKPFRSFVVAWINKLRALHAVRSEAVQPFGWATHDGIYTGIAVGGTLYRADGSEELAPGNDPRLTERYHPQGDYAKWQQAAKLVCTNRPDLQILVAASFGSPLLEHTGHSGIIISCFSRQSGVGKSSAFKVGASVWGTHKTMLALDDTNNAVHYLIGRAKIMPAYWDEVQVDLENAKEFIKTFFKLTQGRDKQRLQANITMRDTGDWRTLMIAAGNAPLMDHVVHERSSTDAGALRLFEFGITQAESKLITTAQEVIALTEQNFGHAGRIYAKYLSQNIDQVRAMMSKAQVTISKDLGADTGERFYIAAIACVMVGARIARKLNIIDFNLQDMYELLKTIFYQLRESRTRNLSYSKGNEDFDEIFSKFMADHSAQRLRTTLFGNRGKHINADFRILALPVDMNKRLAVHVAQQQKTMRIDRQIWMEWCRRKGHSGDQLFGLIKDQYGAYQQRGLMGAHTAAASGRVMYIVLPLTAPELQEYIYETDKSNQPPGPAPALAGFAG